MTDQRFPAGSRWRDTDTGRVVILTGRWANVGPWWYYEDDPAQTLWHCCAEDFTLWGQYVRLT